MGNYQRTYIFMTSFDLERNPKIELPDNCIALKQANIKGIFRLQSFMHTLCILSQLTRAENKGEGQKRWLKTKTNGPRSRSPCFSPEPWEQRELWVRKSLRASWLQIPSLTPAEIKAPRKGGSCLSFLLQLSELGSQHGIVRTSPRILSWFDSQFPKPMVRFLDKQMRRKKWKGANLVHLQNSKVPVLAACVHFKEALINGQQFFSVAETCVFFSSLKVNLYAFVSSDFPPCFFIQEFSQTLCAISARGVVGSTQTWGQRGIEMKHFNGLLLGVSSWTNHSSLTCRFF